MKKRFWIATALLAMNLALGCGDAKKPAPAQESADPSQTKPQSMEDRMPPGQMPPPPPPKKDE